jgi:hypothetical protein
MDMSQPVGSIAPCRHQTVLARSPGRHIPVVLCFPLHAVMVTHPRCMFSPPLPPHAANTSRVVESHPLSRTSDNVLARTGSPRSAPEETTAKGTDGCRYFGL